MTPNPEAETAEQQKKINHLHLLGILLTLAGLGLFVYFVSSVGVGKILHGVARIGFLGFAFLMFLYFLRILARAAAWKLSVYAPHKLSLRDCVEAVIIGEAVSSMIPLGILVSGTAKAVAVRKKVPLVVGLSSVATENLFYSLSAGLVIAFGAIAFLHTFELSGTWAAGLDAVVGVIFLLTVLGFLMVYRRWHLMSAVCDWIYEKGFLRRFLENGRGQVRVFENLIFDFYQRHPQKFVPIFLLQIIYHALGVAEVWFILSRISSVAPDVYTAFLLESISRVITVVFKLIPFLIGVDEAGAKFVTETLALGVGVGVTLAIIRKGRILFWTAAGIVFILRRGLSLKEITEMKVEPVEN